VSISTLVNTSLSKILIRDLSLGTIAGSSKTTPYVGSVGLPFLSYKHFTLKGFENPDLGISLITLRQKSSNDSKAAVS
jgi:hypothetical protein